MPTYEYKCSACGHAFEKFQSITAAPLKKCPKCGKNQARRLIGTGAGLIFKGSGFYITDYRDSSYKDKAKADAPATEAKDSKTETKPSTEAKPAAEPKPATTAPEPKASKSASKSGRSRKK